ncbi:MAG: TonB-dependent receptor plug domain-containing protein [Chthoniobacterales bacterium]
MKNWPVGLLLALVSLSLPLTTTSAEPLPVGSTGTITTDELAQTGEFDVGPALVLNRPDIFSEVDGSVLIHTLPVLTLLDGRRFPISGDLARMGMAPLNVFPIAFLNSVDVQRVSASPVYGSDAAGGAIDLRLKRYYSGGEVGVFYGKSSGKYGREDFQSYIIGGVGNDKFNVTVGASYDESHGHIPHVRP